MDSRLIVYMTPTFIPSMLWPPMLWPRTALKYGQYSPLASPASQAPNLNEIQAEHFKEVGNELLRLHLYPQALQAYNNALTVKPNYTDAWFNIAQTWRIVGNFPLAIQALTQLLVIDSNDHDARVGLGELYEKLGATQIAKRLYIQVLGAKPNFDPAKRNLLHLLYQDQRYIDPGTAHELYNTQKKEVIFKARSLLAQYYTKINPDLEKHKLSQTIPIVFEPTQVVENSENTAEYDHTQKAIRLQPRMVFSSPNVIGAYMAHELVHASDNDNKTSIMEEQDGYRELAKFWLTFKQTEEVPNLDRAVTMFQESPAKLDHEVRLLYTMRNPLIPEKSPGHGMPKNAPAELSGESVKQKYETFIREQLKKRLGFYTGNL